MIDLIRAISCKLRPSCELPKPPREIERPVYQATMIAERRRATRATANNLNVIESVFNQSAGLEQMRDQEQP